jgi:hypothetical protein
MRQLQPDVIGKAQEVLAECSIGCGQGPCQLSQSGPCIVYGGVLLYLAVSAALLQLISAGLCRVGIAMVSAYPSAQAVAQLSGMWLLLQPV